MRGWNGNGSADMKELDQQRIAACLAACEGLSTEVLENIVMIGDTLLIRIKALKEEQA
jgi:hypothetical protein